MSSTGCPLRCFITKLSLHLKCRKFSDWCFWKEEGISPCTTYPSHLLWGFMVTFLKQGSFRVILKLHSQNVADGNPLWGCSLSCARCVTALCTGWATAFVPVCVESCFIWKHWLAQSFFPPELSPSLEKAEVQWAWTGRERESQHPQSRMPLNFQAPKQREKNYCKKVLVYSPD